MQTKLKFVQRFVTYVIPIIALGISLISLKNSWPEDAQLNLMKPSRFVLWHQGDGDRNFQIIVPCVIENTGNKNQSILRVAAILQNKQNPDESHLLQWREFWEYKNGLWRSNSLAHQLNVEPYSSISRNIMFTASSAWLPEHDQYALKLITILDDENNISDTEEATLRFSAEQQAEIRRNFHAKNSRATFIDELSFRWMPRSLDANETQKLMQRK